VSLSSRLAGGRGPTRPDRARGSSLLRKDGATVRRRSSEWARRHYTGAERESEAAGHGVRVRPRCPDLAPEPRRPGLRRVRLARNVEHTVAWSESPHRGDGRPTLGTVRNGHIDIQDVIDGVTEDLGEIIVVASEDVRRFISEQGGDLFLWVSLHGWGRSRIALLEASTERPRDAQLTFRRRPAQLFNLQLEEHRRFWPRTLVLELDAHRRRVCAYWNGQAWVG
jgi:hypothetical protein